MQEAAAAGAGVRAQRRLRQALQQRTRSPLYLGQVSPPLCPGDWAACPGPAFKLGLRQLLPGRQLSQQPPLSRLLNGLNRPP